MRRLPLFVLLIVVTLPFASSAQVTIPSLFSSHAVLQREKPIHIWGTASVGEQVQVRFHKQSAAAKADMWGNWELWLNPEPAGGPFTLSVKGSASTETIERSDILMGDVWMASGQSNMEFPLAGFSTAPLLHGEEEIAHATQPKIRLLMQHRRVSSAVRTDTSDVWQLCTPETARGFSAIAYLFAREIVEKENVAIGLIDATWGGTPAQSWISGDGISYYRLDSVYADNATVARRQGRADALHAQYAEEDAAAKAAGRTPPQHAPIPEDHAGSWAASSLFNGMIAPFVRYSIRGVLWYQGETDTWDARPHNYDRVFSSLIQDWRTQWGEGPFPFLFVQISSFGDYDDSWATVRDQQRLVSEDTPNTAMAVSLDVGQHDNVHPADKQTVAHRLALLARAHVYKEHVAADSPEPIRTTAEESKARVWLDHAEGLHGKSGELSGFEVAGEDGKFVNATAIIEGTTIVASSPAVPTPRFVRYGWKGTVTSFVLNAADLPLGTFQQTIP